MKGWEEKNKFRPKLPLRFNEEVWKDLLNTNISISSYGSLRINGRPWVPSLIDGIYVVDIMYKGRRHWVDVQLLKQEAFGKKEDKKDG